MPIPGAYMPTGDVDDYAEAVQQAPVPQWAHTEAVFSDAATDFARKAARAVPDILYRTLNSLGQGDADSGPDAQARDRWDHSYMQGPALSTDELNERFGIDGTLRFNEPTTEEDAAWRNAQAMRQQYTGQIFNATRPQPLMDFGAGLAGSLVDPVGGPLMLATGGLGEAVMGAREGAEAVEAAANVTRLGRVANALRVPLEGAISNVPYVGANFLLSQYAGDDYDMVDALRDIAAGAILHTSGHFLFKGLKYALGRGDGLGPDVDGSAMDAPPPRPSQPYVRPESVPDAVSALPETSRAGAFVKAIDDLANDDPVDVGQYADRELNPTGLDRLNEQDATPSVRSFRPLNDDVAITQRGTEVPVRYGLAELDDLTTSHTNDLQPNPNYPPELQPRDRSRAGAQAANYDLERRLNPGLLINDASAANGAPIVAPDGVVESGNGRTIALRRSADTDGAAYGRYVEELKRRGINTEGLRRPVLVRMRTQPLEGAGRAALTREMNIETTEGLSPSEQARVDAKAIPDSAFAKVKPNEGPLSSADFTRAFLEKVAPEATNKLADENGRLSVEGARRIRAAVLHRAYDDDALVRQFFEGEDPEAGGRLRNTSEGLADAAPRWAEMRAAARSGIMAPELDLTPELTEAVRLVRQAERDGVSVHDVLMDREGAVDMFTGQSMSPQTEAFLRLFFRDADLTVPRPAEEIAQALRTYAREAMKTPPGAALLGDAHEDAARQILANLAEKYTSNDTGRTASRRAPGKSKRGQQPRPVVVDVPEPGEAGPGGGERPSDGGEAGGAGAGDGERAAAGGVAEAGPLFEGVTADRIIAGDEELRELAATTEQLAAEAGVEPKVAPADDPDTIARAIQALEQCVLAAPEEIL